MTLYGWMIDGVPTVMRGEFAERDAMAAAKRIGGTCKAFAVYRDEPVTELGLLPANTQCNLHPDAPHGFSRNASHSAGRYVCVCEGWVPDVRPQNCGTGHCSCIVCPYVKPTTGTNQ